MLLQLIQTDNDSGRSGARMGQGPGHILAGGSVDRLRAAGHQVERIRVDSRSSFPLEISTAFEVAALLSTQVRMASRQRRFPIILAGNCMASLGAVAGLQRHEIGVVWLDGHGDLHTPETTRSGFLDGMALATIGGLCWEGLAAAVPGFRPIDPANILLLGARDLEREERVQIEQRGIFWRDPDAMRQDAVGVAQAMGRLATAVDRIHLHLDLDVLDPQAVGPANAFAPPAGLHLEELLALVASVKSTDRLASATLSAYDPSGDSGHAVRDAAGIVLEALVA